MIYRDGGRVRKPQIPKLFMFALQLVVWSMKPYGCCKIRMEFVSHSPAKGTQQLSGWCTRQCFLMKLGIRVSENASWEFYFVKFLLITHLNYYNLPMNLVSDRASVLTLTFISKWWWLFSSLYVSTCILKSVCQVSQNFLLGSQWELTIWGWRPQFKK